MTLTKMLTLAGLGLLLVLIVAGCGLAVVPPAAAPLDRFLEEPTHRTAEVRPRQADLVRKLVEADIR